MTGLNPFNWGAPAFLGFYFGLMLLAIFWTLALRWQLDQAEDLQDSKPLELLELAWLRGGALRAADTILINLAVTGAARIETVKSGFFRSQTGLIVGSEWPPEFAEFRGYVDTGLIDRNNFRSTIMPMLQRLHHALSQRGLVLDEDSIANWKRKSWIVFSAVLAVGGLRILIGLSREHPVGYLVCLVAITLVAAIWTTNAAPRLTPTGRALLQREVERHGRAARAPIGAELPLAFALSGPAILSGTAFAALSPLFENSQGGDGGGGGCGGGGGGGGGCGG